MSHTFNIALAQRIVKAATHFLQPRGGNTGMFLQKIICFVFCLYHENIFISMSISYNLSTYLHWILSLFLFFFFLETHRWTTTTTNVWNGVRCVVKLLFHWNSIFFFFFFCFLFFVCVSFFWSDPLPVIHFDRIFLIPLFFFALFFK